MVGAKASLSEQHPREQGLKLVFRHRKERKLFLSEQHPREQGLKLLKQPEDSYYYLELSEQHPREQGLKPINFTTPPDM